MEAIPGPSSPQRGGPTGTIGEFVILTGRLKGTRRALGVPLTFIGRAPACDIRLNVDGINPLHCLVAHGPDGLILRDLDSEHGTLVNGQRISSCLLRDGDHVAVGPFQFKVNLPKRDEAAPSAPKEEPTAETSTGTTEQAQRPEREALRIQVAAVVAQQAALAEEETRLQQRRATLEQQESQLGAHLEEKRRRLVELHAQAQAARENLRQEKDLYATHVQRVTSDLSQAERDLLEKQHAVDQERQHLLELRRRLKQRHHQHRTAERENLQRREQELANSLQRLEKESERFHQERAALAQAVLRFNGDVELGRRQLQDEWDKFRREQKQWKEQRAQEEGALREWAFELEQREANHTAAEKALAQEQASWQAKRTALHKEVEGLENRCRNQRRKVVDQQQEIDRLEQTLRELRRHADPSGTPEALTGSGGLAKAAPDPTASSPPARTGTALAVTSTPAPERSLGVLDAAYESATALQSRVEALERLAGDLADQRLQVAEQWERVAQTREQWLQERNAAGAELKALAMRLQQQGQALLAREQELEASACELRQRHDELLHLRQHLLGWQSRLRARETNWEGERDRMLAELRAREELADRHLSALVEVRQRWAKRRRQELEQVRAERDACEKVRQQYAALREERRRKNRELEEERRNLTSKALALEEYRRECLSRASDAAAAERRIDRLRRRWVTENANSLRSLAREREALQTEAAHLQEQFQELQKRSEEITNEKAALSERVTEWEHRQTIAEAQHAQIRQELQSLHAQRERANQQMAELQAEVERIARQLLEEPDAPQALLEKAA